MTRNGWYVIGGVGAAVALGALLTATPQPPRTAELPQPSPGAEAKPAHGVEPPEAASRAGDMPTPVAVDAPEGRTDDLYAAREPSTAGEHSEITGTVTSVNSDAHLLAVQEASGLPTYLRVEGDIPVTYAGQPLSLQDVRIGDTVQLHLQGELGRRVIQSIVIHERHLPTG